ncbi:ribosome-inactivating family protein [Streptomyces sp. NR30]|uniref:Ribosome-inactivating family protein n=1 Tax=Streptomyces guryensis TaxID=2886947 RepID=A0A9Q3Z9M2_9ACTN|nr:ribosome-inactivating family protein [Streptomyces guryensis]MCD9878459.1 ribosome-inactivating family protein [Streptomyces guryensis]
MRISVSSASTVSAARLDDGWPEGYDALARAADRPLTDVRIGFSQFEDAVRTFHNPRSTYRDTARAMLTFIVGVAEAGRILPLHNRIRTAIGDWTSYGLTTEDVYALHHWADASEVYRNDRGRVNVYGRTYTNAKSLVALLITCLGAKAVQNGNPKTEL